VRKLLTLSALIVLLDQITKLAVKGFNLFGIHHEGMQLYESRQVIGNLLRFTFVENPGMAFGLNFGMPVILSLFSIGASVFLVYLLKRTDRDGINGLRVALALILSGAVGNLIDRVFYGICYGYAPLFYGKVVDFVDFDLPDLNILRFHLERFYVFNIADAAVTVGVVLLLIYYPSHKHDEEQREQLPPVDGTQAAPESSETVDDGTHLRMTDGEHGGQRSAS
jgi:signal peptidase II